MQKTHRGCSASFPRSAGDELRLRHLRSQEHALPTNSPGISPQKPLCLILRESPSSADKVHSARISKLPRFISRISHSLVRGIYHVVSMKEQPSRPAGQKQGLSRRTVAARENGREGGYARASGYSGDVLSEWASHGGKAVLAKYGPEYFSELRKRRKNYRKRDESPVVKPNWRKIQAWGKGQKGGLARAGRYSPECFREWGRIGGIETLVRYGKKFYSEIRKKRKHYKPPGYMTRRTKMRWRQKCERQAKTRLARRSGLSYLWEAVAKNFAT
jgi:hypothetical protein